ncbi:MAG: hypothetical protein QXV22_04410, partial [Thermoplasmataceae archaeon]
MMTNGAISFLNAIPTGFGCAVGIRLPMSVRIQNQSTASLGETIPARILMEAFGNVSDGIEITIESSIPAGFGLKSSSALVTATIGEFALFRGISMHPVEICKVAANVSRKLGLAVTGAFDDAAASVLDGVFVTDN